MVGITKRQNGQFYTRGNPFQLTSFQKWVERNGLTKEEILEPFAGANNLVHALREVGMAREAVSFDIAPSDKAVKYRDTLAQFPEGFTFCVTNPPWLAKNSAKRRGLSFPDTQYDDLYKYALRRCLDNCAYVAALIPATFLQSGEMRARLDSVIFLHDQGMFADTENPVCLALFNESLPGRISIYNDDRWIGFLDNLEREIPQTGRSLSMAFNHPEGELGFVAFDNTREPSIHFCEGRELNEYSVGFSTRMITRIKGDFDELPETIERLNTEIERFRLATEDTFLTPFKGLRKDGKYRRRMDYRLARRFIEAYA